MSRHNKSRLDEGFEDMVRRIYDICEDAMRETGNISVTIMKCLDPIGLGVCLQHFDPLTNDHAFLPGVVADVVNDFPMLEKYLHSIIQVYKNHLTKYGMNGIPSILECYGQEKIHFFPLVSLEEGLLKMYRYGTAYRFPDISACDKLAADFKRVYICSYYQREGVLPKIVWDENLCEEIKTIYTKGVPGSTEHCKRIHWKEWEKIHFQKHQNFNYFPDILDLLDDKAVTPHRNQMNVLFAQDALHVLGLATVKTPVHTRLILEMLSRETIDIREFYETVTKLGYIPANWTIIQLMAKERELKISARDFSILTFECRMMASVCERNLSDTIFPYISEQSMTKSGLELRHTIDSFINLKNDDKHVWITFNMDIEQWNYTFRQVLQQPMATVLNELFGVNYFSIIPRIFTESVLFSSDSYSPPGTKNEFTYWDNHAGGNQGIAQKFWTLITIMIIRSVMEKLGLDYMLMGSGDNQVMKVKILKSLLTQGIVNKVKVALAEGFRQVGLGLKIGETWFSSEIFNYQRKYYLNNRPVPNGLKQALRSFSGGGDLHNGIGQITMTSMNGGVGLSCHTSDLWIGPLFAYTEALSNILYNPTFKGIIPMSQEHLIALTLCGTEVGMLPFLQITSFGYAGHQDKLSESLAILKYVWENYPKMKPIISSILNVQRGENSESNQIQLVLDPQSLNV